MPKQKKDSTDEVKIPSYQRMAEEIFNMLAGDKLTKDATIEEYRIKDRSFSRDMEVIKGLYTESDDYDFVHDTSAKNFYLKKKNEIPIEEIIAIMKMLMGSQAFTRNDVDSISYDLLQTVGNDDHDMVSNMLSAISSGYQPIKSMADKDDLLEDILLFNKWVNERAPIEYTYTSTAKEPHTSTVRLGVPLSLFFADHYFYVAMYVVDDENPNQGVTYVHRVDRFNEKSPKPGKRITVPSDKIEGEKEIRNRTYLLNSGGDVSYTFSYTGHYQTALDQLKNSKVRLDRNGNPIKDEKGAVTIEGHLSFNGALMWVWGQGDKVVVKAPSSLAKKVKETLQNALDGYQK